MYSFDLDPSIPLQFCPSCFIFFFFFSSSGLLCFCGRMCAYECVSLYVCVHMHGCVKCDSTSMSSFYLPCFPAWEYHKSLMSSSLLQILAGVFSLIESPLDPKVVMLPSCCLCVMSVCVCFLACIARDEMLSKDKGKQKDMHGC